MREYKRIPELMMLVNELWTLHQDLRFIQLVDWITEGEDWFYKEDEEIIERLKELLDEEDDQVSG